jgi:hypothetical protein
MTRKLEEAISRLRELPEEEQDAAAMAVFAYITSDDRNDPMSVVERPERDRSRLIH